MADETTPAPSGLFPTLQSIASASWGAIARWAAVILAGLVAYAAYSNATVIGDWLKPPPPPTVVEYVPAAKFKALEAKVEAMAANTPDAAVMGAAVSIEEFSALEARVAKIEKAATSKKRR